MSVPIDALIDRWIGRLQNASHAYSQDPAYFAQIGWMRRMLHLADMAMEDEGVPEDTRERIIRAVIYGGPDENAAMERIEAMQHAVSRLTRLDPP